MGNIKRKIDGVFVPIATPFDDNGDLDLAHLAENTTKFGRTKLAGIVALGSNGEFVFLSHKEKLGVIETIRENLPQDKLVIAGTGCESLRETIALTKEAANLGIDAALVINPNYYTKAMSSESNIEKFYKAVADSSPVPIMIYNMPGNSGVNIPSKVTVRLAAHPNIAGIKDSSGNIVQISEVLVGISDLSATKDFAVFAGSASFLFATTVLGGRGGTLATANVAPDLCAELYQLSRDGDIARARELQLKLLKLNSYMTAVYGIPGLKAAMDMVGFYGGKPREPLQPTSNEVKASIRSELERLNLLERYR